MGNIKNKQELITKEKNKTKIIVAIIGAIALIITSLIGLAISVSQSNKQHSEISVSVNINGRNEVMTIHRLVYFYIESKNENAKLKEVNEKLEERISKIEMGSQSPTPDSTQPPNKTPATNNEFNGYVIKTTDGFISKYLFDEKRFIHGVEASEISQSLNLYTVELNFNNVDVSGLVVSLQSPNAYSGLILEHSYNAPLNFSITEGTYLITFYNEGENDEIFLFAHGNVTINRNGNYTVELTRS
jgi:cell division protein FtsB